MRDKRYMKVSKKVCEKKLIKSLSQRKVIMSGNIFPIFWLKNELSQIVTFQECDSMGRLKEIVAVTTKIVSNTDSIMRISLQKSF